MVSKHRLNRSKSGSTTSSGNLIPIVGASHAAGQIKVPKQLRTAIAREHGACQAAAANAVLHAIAAGKSLVAAKSLVGNGSWGRWLANNFSEDTGLTERTAQRYMRIARNVDQLLEQAREEHQREDPTRVSDLSEADILRQVTITRALKMIGGNGPQRRPAHHRRVPRSSLIQHNEWATPPEIIEAAEQFLGGIHVDPCAARERNAVPATTQFTVDDDGLGETCIWTGNVFVNPGQHGDISLWVVRALEFLESGCLNRAVLVLPCVTDASWTPKLASFPHAFCRRRPQVQCCRVDAATLGLLPHPVMLVGLSSPEAFAEFADAFGEIADVFFSAARSSVSKLT